MFQNLPVTPPASVLITQDENSCFLLFQKLYLLGRISTKQRTFTFDDGTSELLRWRKRRYLDDFGKIRKLRAEGAKAIGNQNSGRRFFADTKATVEESYSVDITRLTRQGLAPLESFHTGRLEWRNTRMGDVASSIDYFIDMRDRHVQLQYVLAGTGEQLNYRVNLVATSPQYGGLRWWFLCPVSAAGRPCGRRVRKLYRPPGGKYFACRQCSRLSYASQRQDRMDRALSEAQKIRVRLGGSASMGQPFPEKPKRMWWKTYHRLQLRSEGVWVESLRVGLGLPPD